MMSLEMEEQRSFRTFITVWAGQVVSVVGSGITSFGLAVWVLQRTGSATQYAMILLAAIAPMVVVSPIAGVYVDRWDRRRTMIVSDLVAGLSTLGIAAALFFSELQLWHIIVATCMGSCAGVFQRPAYTAATTLIVPKEHLGRAAGLVQIAEPLSTILAPILGAMFIGLVGLRGVLIIDFATFLVAMATLAVARFPEPERKPVESKPSIYREAMEGWQYIAQRKGLLHMMWFLLLVNFIFGFVSVLYAPLVLSFAGAPGLGTVMAFAGVGGIVGGIAMGIWGGPKNRAAAIFLVGALIGLAVAMTGLRPSIVLVSFATFVTMALVAVISSIGQALWQVKTEPGVQGRVFALRGMFAMLAIPIAYVIAGPLADRVFEPAMRSQTRMAELFGLIVGTGEGRGLALLCVIAGLAATLASLVAYATPTLRNLEDDLPDALPDESQPAPA